MQRILRRVSPVHFYYPHYKLRDRQMYYEWALLDTHDGTTDFYKHHRKPLRIKNLLEEIGASDIVVEIGGREWGRGIVQERKPHIILLPRWPED